MRRYTFPILFIMILSALIPGITERAEAIPSNYTLPDGTPVFHLLGQSTQGTGPSPTEFFVGFNATPISAPSDLVLAGAGSPILNNPSTGQDFSIFWGMKPPNPSTSITFNLPSDPAATGVLYPPNPCLIGSSSSCFSFSASDGTNSYDVFFDIAGPTAIDPASSVMARPPPANVPENVSAVRFDFSFMSASDPTLSFRVLENGQPLNFTPVPEPTTLLLLGSGLIGLVAMRRK